MSATVRLRILLIDDHAIVRRGLRQVFTEGLTGGCSFGEAASAAEALQVVRSGSWDLVVLDVSLPGRGGFDVLKDITRLRPGLRVLMLGLQAEGAYAVRAFRSGAAGYVTKDNTPEELLAAAKKVLVGGRYMAAEVAESLAAGLAKGTRAAHELLSAREHQVLRLLATGHTVKEIAAELRLSEKTISTYRARILEKMRMRTTAQLMGYALRAGLVE
jgi:two-component system, NarL family, invasion response regulator UvrY